MVMASVLQKSQDANVSPVQSDLEEYTGKVGAWENFLERMVAAVEEGNQAGVSLLVFHYWPFRSTQWVLDRVSKRYGDSCTLRDRDGGGQECLKNIFSCLLLTWLHEFPDDFCETSHFPSLKQLVAFTQMALPGSTLERQAQLLLSELEPSGPSETQTQEQKAPVTAPPMPPTDVEPLWPPELLPPSPTIITPAPEREAALISPTWPRPEAASSPDRESKLETSPALPAELAVALMPTQLPPSDQKPVTSLDLAPAASPPEAPTEQQEADQVPPAVPSVELQSVPAVTAPEDHSCSSRGRREQGLRERKVPVLAFPPRLLAEQLTKMDVELFRKVVAFDCVQAISTLCSEKGEEHLAPTICAVITQMHRVSNCVITTCLSGQSTTASDKARILEHWVEVARECQVLLNFASLDAILSALWSNSIQHLKQTWKEVSRDSIDHLEMMSKTSQKRELPGQPTVPDLWTLLSELASLQLAPTDSREGRLRNYDIGLKEYKVIPRIERLQAGCIYIYFRPMEEFRAWFGAVEQLSISECFHLSCEQEPPALSASNILDAPNLPEVGKPWSTGPQELSAEPSCSSASLPSVRLQLGRDRSSGVTAVSLPGHEADASKSDQEMSVGLISKCPDGQEEQIGDSTFKSDHPQPGAPLSAHRASSPLQSYRKQVDDSCIIHVSLDGDHVNMPKSIVGSGCDPQSPGRVPPGSGGSKGIQAGANHLTRSKKGNLSSHRSRQITEAGAGSLMSIMVQHSRGWSSQVAKRIRAEVSARLRDLRPWRTPWSHQRPVLGLPCLGPQLPFPQECSIQGHLHSRMLLIAPTSPSVKASSTWP
ncbi:ral guanine nucleotide dissociation stimulator-like isoform X4 [Tamandua tetradactyla]|uniref:ral guanine nucleotide dissociation stimulator-like isoform X4 n=1 Tax=Tamandua tetradactyla TaxID=48850 RepID=UPI0040548108